MAYKITDYNEKIKEYKEHIVPIKLNNIEIKYNHNTSLKGYLYNKEEKYGDGTIELFIDNKLSMEISPREIQGAFQIIKDVKEKVGIIGLGLGYITQEILKKDSVSKVIVYETNKDIIDIYYKNFGKNPKLTILNEDGFKGKSDSFNSFIVDIYSYNLEDRVVEDYKTLNKVHNIEEYYFFGFEHFLLSCPTSEIAFVYVPEYWTEAIERCYRQLMDNGYINDFKPLEDEKVTEILLKFKEVL
ncbi:MAG: hypothetical protein Q4B63_05210 [Clostridium perfringens]|nr:hypothetical protein [Clostridium perfringens]